MNLSNVTDSTDTFEFTISYTASPGTIISLIMNFLLSLWITVLNGLIIMCLRISRHKSWYSYTSGVLSIVILDFLVGFIIFVRLFTVIQTRINTYVCSAAISLTWMIQTASSLNMMRICVTRLYWMSQSHQRLQPSTLKKVTQILFVWIIPGVIFIAPFLYWADNRVPMKKCVWRNMFSPGQIQAPLYLLVVLIFSNLITSVIFGLISFKLRKARTFICPDRQEIEITTICNFPNSASDPMPDTAPNQKRSLDSYNLSKLCNQKKLKGLTFKDSKPAFSKSSQIRLVKELGKTDRLGHSLEYGVKRNLSFESTGSKLKDTNHFQIGRIYERTNTILGCFNVQRTDKSWNNEYRNRHGNTTISKYCSRSLSEPSKLPPIEYGLRHSDINKQGSIANVENDLNEFVKFSEKEYPGNKSLSSDEFKITEQKQQTLCLSLSPNKDMTGEEKIKFFDCPTVTHSKDSSGHSRDNPFYKDVYDQNDIKIQDRSNEDNSLVFSNESNISLDESVRAAMNEYEEGALSLKQYVGEVFVTLANTEDLVQKMDFYDKSAVQQKSKDMTQPSSKNIFNSDDNPPNIFSSKAKHLKQNNENKFPEPIEEDRTVNSLQNPNTYTRDEELRPADITVMIIPDNKETCNTICPTNRECNISDSEMQRTDKEVIPKQAVNIVDESNVPKSEINQLESQQISLNTKHDPVESGRKNNEKTNEVHKTMKTPRIDQLIQTIGILVVLINISVLPYTILLILEIIRPQNIKDTYIPLLALFFFMLKSAFNPIVYGIRIKPLRTAFVRMCKKVCCKGE